MQLNEAKLQDALILKLGGRPDTRVWRNSVGVYRHLHNDGVVRIGSPGMSDLFGTSRGWFLSIEVKSHRGRLTGDQRNWLEMVGCMGGFQHVAKLDGEGDLEAQIARAVELCEQRLEAFHHTKNNAPV